MMKTLSGPLLPALAALALVLGYVDLIRGGITLSAFLLAIAHCVLIPMSIWYFRAEPGKPAPVATRAAGDDSDERPPYGAAAIAAAAVFLLYLITLSPTTAMWDASEYIAAAFTFGLPHPPGNPFFIIIGRVFSVLPISSNIGARVNILAALCSAVAAGMWFLIAQRVFSRWLEARWQSMLGAAIATLIGATAFTVWNQSVVNEKVYTIGLAGIAIISWLAVRWLENPNSPKADRLLVMMAYLCGLGYANHMAGMLPVLAIIAAIVSQRPRLLMRWRLVAVGVAVMLLGLTPFATQPIRAGHFPAINEGAPSACRTKLEFSCTFSKGTLDLFLQNFNRDQYPKAKLLERQAPFDAQIGMWWLYFKWQWLRDPNNVNPVTQNALAATFLLLGFLGAWVHFQRDRRTFWYFGPLMLTVTLLLIFYLNFKYGASQSPDLQVPHEVRDRDYFYIWSFSPWGIWAALGLFYIWESLAQMFGASTNTAAKKASARPTVTTRGWALACPVLLLALVPMASNWRWASRAGHHDTRDFAHDMLNSLEPYGVLIVVGDNDTFPLWYAQEVEGIRKDVVVANTSLLGTDWHPRQIIQRPIYEYDAAKGPAVYRDKQWTKPPTPPLKMTLNEADSVPSHYQFTGPQSFRAGELEAIIDARNLEYGVLLRADYFVLRIIQDSWTERPIYFSRSSGPYPRQLGLAEKVLIQGLASKVFVPPDSTRKRVFSADTVFVEGEGWLDVKRTQTLWDSVYLAQESFIKKGAWIDRPSVTIPYLYVVTGVELAHALALRGKTDDALRVFEETRKVAVVMRLQDITDAAAPIFRGLKPGG